MVARRLILPQVPILLGLFLALACGGGGGGASGPAQSTTGTGYGLAPTAGPGDVAGFFPTDTGDPWFYNLTGSDGTTTTQSLLVNNEVQGAVKKIDGVVSW